MKLAVIVLTCALCAFGQALISIQPYAAGYLSSAPHSAAGVTILAGRATDSVVSYTTYEMRPLSLKMTPVTVGRTGVQWTVASSGKLDFALLGQAGGAGSNTSTSLAAAFGGSINVVPGFKSMPGLYFNGTLQGVGQSAALGGWNPEISLGVGYQIQGFSLGTLSSRKKMGAKPELR